MAPQFLLARIPASLSCTDKTRLRPCPPLLRTRHHLALPRDPSSSRRHSCTRLSAADDDQPPEPEKDSSARKDPEEYYVDSLKKIGVDQTSAKRILTVWKEAGVDDPDALRRLYLKGTLRPLGLGLLQALLDLGAAAGAFSAATAFGAMGDFPFQLGVEAVCYFVAFYFVSSLFFDVATLGVVAYSLVRFGTNPEAYVRAVEKIAGEFAVVTKAQASVDAFKVSQALNTIADLLREEKSSIAREDDRSTLSNLAEYLAFVRAKEEFGFDPATYNLSDEDASRIVNQFNQYDLNDDGVLEIRELGNLCDSLGPSLTADELSAAMKILDTDDSGVIEFDEFVDWWANKVSADRLAD